MSFVWLGSLVELRHHLTHRGVKIEAGPVVRYGGTEAGHSMYFRDPDGSLLVFITYDAREH